MVADEIVAILEAKIDKYTRNLKTAEGQFVRTSTLIERHSDRLGKTTSKGMILATGALGGLIAGFASQLPQAIATAISSGLEYASSLGEQAQQLGVTSDALQEYRYIATQVGVSQKEMDKGLQFLTRSFGQAQDGSKRILKALKDVGFSAEETNRLIHMTAGDAIPELAEKLSAIEDPAKRARIEMALFGRAGQQLDTLLAGGRSEVDNLRKAAHDLGIVLSEKEIQDADKTADKLAEIKTVLMARMASIIAQNSDSILGLADAFEKLTREIPGALAWLKAFYRDAQILAQKAQINAIDVAETLLPHSLGGANRDANRAAAQDRLRNLQFEKEKDRVAGFFVGNNPFGPPAGSKQRDVAYDVENAGKAVAAEIAQTGESATRARTTARDASEEAQRQAKEAQETLRQYTDDLSRMEGEILSVSAELANTTEARAAAQKKNIEIERDIQIRSIQADEQMSEAQKAELITRVRHKAALDEALVDQEAANQIARDALEIAQSANQNEQDVLRASLELEPDRKKRAALERKLVDLAFEQERIALRDILNSTQASNAQKQIAQARLDILDGLQAQARESANRANEGPAGQKIHELEDTLVNINDEIDAIAIDKLEQVGDALGESAKKALGLHGILGDLVADMFKLFIRTQVLLPLMKSLFGGGGGGGGGLFGSIGNILGGLGSIFGGGGGGGGTFETDPFQILFGRAQGGNVLSGQSYIVGENGPEVFRAPASGRIIPNHQLAGGVGGQSTVTVIVGSGELFDAKVASISGQVSVETIKQATPLITDLSVAKARTIFTRPKI